jgi:hypothetical protein
MDQPPPPDDGKPGELAAARAVAAEESARQRAWRATARSSTGTVVRAQRRSRLLLPVLVASSLLLALACGALLWQLQARDAQEPAAYRRPPAVAHAPATATVAVPTAPAVEPPAPGSAEPPPVAPTGAPPPTPLVITIPLAQPPAEPPPPAALPPPAPPLSPDERRQLQLYERRLAAGADLLARDLAERERTIATTQRRLTFEPDRQPPLGAIEELAEAVRYYDGATGDERERLSAVLHNRRAEVANLQRQLVHDQEVAASLRKRLEDARQELDAARKKLGPPP